jgi:formylglycine-generating enzyme required for sulfatase activity
MGLTEVTQDQFLALTGDAPSHFADCGGDCPVEMVNWHLAAWYANLRSEAEGLAPFYECVAGGEGLTCSSSADPYTAEGWRLPTEAEWEAAASCGEGTLYAGSNLVDEVAWYDGNAGASSHAVASLAPNACGLYDMSGNVSEWVHDWYDAGTYSAEESIDPVGGETGIMRILRGGSWYNLADSVQVSVRGPYDPAHPNASGGFRLARTVPEGG